jgi:hypothetical protein
VHKKSPVYVIPTEGKWNCNTYFHRGNMLSYAVDCTQARFMEHEMKGSGGDQKKKLVGSTVSSHVSHFTFHILIRCWVPGVGPVRLSLVFLGL